MPAVHGAPDTIVFTRAATVRAVARCLPSCPEIYVDIIVLRVRGVPWPHRTQINTAVYRVAHAFIRHALTDYHRWLRKREFTRQEAFLICKPENDGIFAEWCQKPDGDTQEIES